MIRPLVFTIFLCIPAFLFSIGEYEVNDTLYIWAKFGLNVRQAPSLESEKLTTIPFGQLIKTLEAKSWFSYFNDSTTLTDQFLTDHNEKVNIRLRGQWIKIQYESFEGYVFDAFLSKARPVDVREEYYAIFGYLKNATGVLRYFEKRESPTAIGKDKMILGNGTFVENTYYKAGLTIQMTIPDYTIEEIYLLIQFINVYTPELIQDDLGNLEIKRKLGGYSIRAMDNMIRINGSWGC